MESSTELVKLKSFTCFPDLPSELRHMIFRWSLHEEREVLLGIKLGEPRNKSLRVLSIRDPSSTTEAEGLYQSPTTSALFVCKESREIALKILQPAFGGVLPSPVVLNLQLDTLAFENFDAVIAFFHVLHRSRKLKTLANEDDYLMLRKVALHNVDVIPGQMQRIFMYNFIMARRIQLVVKSGAWDVCEKENWFGKIKILVKQDFVLINNAPQATTGPYPAPEFVFEREN